MLTDARVLADGTTLEADVCVVGAGPAGITIGLELSGSGLEVLLLDSGGPTPQRDDQRLANGENADPCYYRLRRSRVIGFGGSSNHWMPTSGMRARPLDPLDFEARPEVGRLGWPFGREVLDPYYSRAQERCRLGPYDYDLAHWSSPSGYPLPLDGALAESVMFQVAALGHFPAQLQAIAEARDVHLLSHATALCLEADDRAAKVRSVEVGAGKKRLRVRARAVVLASGGIENARMLLLSTGAHPAGLGNGHDLVGRHLMEHPHVRTGVLVPADGSLAEQLGLYERADANGVERFAMLKLPDEVVRAEELLGCAWSLHPAHPALVSAAGRALVGLREAAIEFRRLIPGTGTRARTVIRHPVQATRALAAWRFPGSRPPVFQLAAMSEQAPNPHSRVVLGRKRDPFGRPVARVDWRLTGLDHRTIRRSQELLDEAFRKAGLGYVAQPYGSERPPTVLGGGFHHIGTTRMATQASEGVVDADCRVHGVDNLYVAGMSVFPTAGYANPTLTVVALAIRLAEHLATQLED